MLGVEVGRVDRLLQVQPAVDVARRTCSAHCSCWSPPGVPYASHGSPPRSTSPGESVVRGRVRGTSDDASPSSSQNICARVPSGQPSAGIVGELWSQPPRRRRREEVAEAVGDVEVNGVAARRLADAE